MTLFDFIDFKATISIIVILLIIGYNFVSAYRSEEYYRFWSPMIFVSLVFLYYTIYAPLSHIISQERTYLDNMSYGLSYAWYGACLSLCCIVVGFKFAQFKYKEDTTVIPLQDNKLIRTGLVIFLLGTLMYSAYRPIRFSIESFSDDFSFTTMGTWGMYLINGPAFFVCACCLFLPVLFKGKKYYLLLFILFTISTYIIGGFRYRLVYLIISLATMYHLYFQKKIKLLIWIPVGIAFFLSMGIIVNTRNYAKGIDLKKAKSLSTEQMVNGARDDGLSVFYFSGAVMKQIEDRNSYIYFEPIFTALMFPIPRKLYANKPDGKYLSDAQEWVFGYSWGAAMLIYAEAFFAFGWIGIILNGLFIGWLSKYFWLRFLNNRFSFNSILLLSLYNGYIYFMLSRGYLAAQFMTFMFYIVIPYLFYKKMYSFKEKK